MCIILCNLVTVIKHGLGGWQCYHPKREGENEKEKEEGKRKREEMSKRERKKKKKKTKRGGIGGPLPYDVGNNTT